MSFTSKKINQCSSEQGDAHTLHSLYNFFIEVFKPFIWQLPLARFQSIPSKEFVYRPPHPPPSTHTHVHTQVGHKSLDSLGSFSCTLLGVKGSPPPHRLLWNLLFNGVRGRQRAGEGEPSDCFTPTFSIYLLNAAPFYLFQSLFFHADIFYIIYERSNIRRYHCVLVF